MDGWADGSGRDKKLCIIGVTTICPRGSVSVMMGRGARSEPWGTPVGDNEIYLGNMSGNWPKDKINATKTEKIEITQNESYSQTKK